MTILGIYVRFQGGERKWSSILYFYNHLKTKGWIYKKGEVWKRISPKWS